MFNLEKADGKLVKNEVSCNLKVAHISLVPIVLFQETRKPQLRKLVQIHPLSPELGDLHKPRIVQSCHSSCHLTGPQQEARRWVCPQRRQHELHACAPRGSSRAPWYRSAAVQHLTCCVTEWCGEMRVGFRFHGVLTSSSSVRMFWAMEVSCHFSLTCIWTHTHTHTYPVLNFKKVKWNFILVCV